MTQSCCLGYKAGRIRCLSSHQKQYSEQPRILSVQATQRHIFFNSFFVLSVVSQSLPPPSVDACHHLPTFHVDMSLNYLSWENWTESLVTSSGQTCWAGVLKPADVRTLCVSLQGTNVCEELLYLQKADLASLRSFSLMKSANVTCLQGW